MDLLSLLRARFVRNSAVRFFNTAVAKLVSLVIVVSIARFLGPAQLGKYSFTLYLANVLTVVAAMGIPFFLMRELPRLDEQNRRNILTTSLLVLVAVSSTLLVLTLILPHLVGFRPNLLVALSLASLWIIASFIDATFVGLEKQEKTVVPTVLRELTRLAVSIYGVFVIGYYLFPLLGQAVGYAVFIPLMVFALYPYLGGTVSKIREVLSRSFFYLLSGVVGLLFVYVDTLMLYLLAGAEAAGYYRVPGSIVGSVLQLYPFTVASYPALSRRMKEGDPRGAFSLYLKPLFLTSLLYQVGVILLGYPLILFLFGDQYTFTYPLLVLLSLLIPARTFYYYTLQAVTLLGGERIQFLFPAVGLSLNVFLNALLIPSLGIYGAGIATVVSFLFSGVVAYLWLGKRFKEVASG